MDRNEFEVKGNECVKYTPVVGLKGVYKSETVITKEAFIKCYNAWIKSEDEAAEQE